MKIFMPIYILIILIIYIIKYSKKQEKYVLQINLHKKERIAIGIRSFSNAVGRDDPGTPTYSLRKATYRFYEVKISSAKHISSLQGKHIENPIRDLYYLPLLNMVGYNPLLKKLKNACKFILL